ncbi:calcium uniporter protein, partial [Tanacetum coccineum]
MYSSPSVPHMKILQNQLFKISQFNSGCLGLLGFWAPVVKIVLAGTVDINNLHIPFTYQHILASSHNINSLIAQSAHHTSQDGDYRISLCYTMNRQEVNNSFSVPTQPTNSHNMTYTAYLRDHKGEYEHWDPSKMETIMGYMEHSRKRTANKLITGILWSAYLLADWAVGFAIGLIANSDWSSGLNTMEAKNHYSFWASFLLVHLGERTHAFYLASSNRFKDSIIGVGDLGENYVNLIRVYVSRVKLNIPARIVKLPGKGIISYMYLSQKERSQSRHFFLNRTVRDGFKVFEDRVVEITDTSLAKFVVGSHAIYHPQNSDEDKQNLENQYVAFTKML